MRHLALTDPTHRSTSCYKRFEAKVGDFRQLEGFRLFKITVVVCDCGTVSKREIVFFLPDNSELRLFLCVDLYHERGVSGADSVHPPAANKDDSTY